MKIGIVILVYVALFIFVVYEISKHYKEIYESQQFEFESKIHEKDVEIKSLKQKLEEAMNNEKIKKEYSKDFDNYKKEFYKKLSNIEDILKSYGNPVLAISKVKSIIKEF